MRRSDRQREEQQRQTRYESICHPLLVVCAGGFNVPALLFGIWGGVVETEPDNEACDNDNLSGWLVGNACLTAINLAAAFYVVFKIRAMYETNNPINIRLPRRSTRKRTARAAEEAYNDDRQDRVENGAYHIGTRGTDSSGDEDGEDGESSPPADEEEESSSGGEEASESVSLLQRIRNQKTLSSERIRHLICYNGFVATYAILFLFWIVWLFQAANRPNVDDENNGQQLDEDCDDSLHERYVHISVICGFCYAGVVVVSLLASLYQ